MIAALVCQWIRAFRRCMPTADVTTGMVEFIQCAQPSIERPSPPTLTFAHHRSFADELQPLAAALVADGWWASRWHCSRKHACEKAPVRRSCQHASAVVQGRAAHADPICLERG
eukprot:TRINITY_DN2_c0_g1_i2.p2 TRINITY_DN2_c0_g1~~TRINITY_DN2_c0_g1_i2.p2  ORF type:complete len:114 (-),score=10.35 TRINITY_DN2_c0_g1_i2:563-904(-)